MKILTPLPFKSENHFSISGVDTRSETSSDDSDRVFGEKILDQIKFIFPEWLMGFLT